MKNWLKVLILLAVILALISVPHSVFGYVERFLMHYVSIVFTAIFVATELFFSIFIYLYPGMKASGRTIPVTGITMIAIGGYSSGYFLLAGRYELVIAFLALYVISVLYDIARKKKEAIFSVIMVPVVIAWLTASGIHQYYMFTGILILLAGVAFELSRTVAGKAEEEKENEFGYEPLDSSEIYGEGHLASFQVIKSWPSQGDYQRAFQNLKFSISSKYPEVREGAIIPNPNVRVPGNIIYSSGNYGTIFKMSISGKEYAIKCFTKSSRDIQRRYYEISRYLRAAKNKYAIDAITDFHYLNQFIRTLKDPTFYYPALKMDWIDGMVLNSFILQNLGNREVIKSIADNFIKLLIKLHSLRISHGDLAGDNILVRENFQITLIDYDGMYVPAFSGESAPELGHEHFQHPNRSSADFNENLDNFSALVIYESLLAVAEDPGLWSKFNHGDYDCLIFRSSDFKRPAESDLFSALISRKGKVGSLAKLMMKALDHDALWDQITPQKIARVQ